MPVARPPRASSIDDVSAQFVVQAAHISAPGKHAARWASSAVACLVALSWAPVARALPAAPGAMTPVAAAAPTPTDRDKATHEQSADEGESFRLGALAGVGFPRPVSVEIMTKLGGYVGVGGEYGLLPQISVDGIQTSTWAASGDLRLFLFRGAFFFGLRGGYQHMAASTNVTAAGLGSASGSVELDSWFVNPRLGFLWTVSWGFTIGIEAGVQLPLSTSFSTSLPSAVALQIHDSTPVKTLSGVLPTVDLLRIGMLF